MRAAPRLEFTSAVAASLLLACGTHTAGEVSATEPSTAASSESSGPPAPALARLHGGVEKGPLLLGSTITASRLDASGSPTGSQYPSQIADDSGAFEVGELPLGIYLLEGVGHHFDEVSGELSRAPITLRAVVELDGGGEPVFVNVLSHLAHRRVLALLTDGVEVGAALAQADAEVLAALPIGAPTDTAIYRARRDDGSELRLVAQNGPESPVHQPAALQVDATHVWWINPYVGDQPSASGQLVRTRIP